MPVRRLHQGPKRLSPSLVANQFEDEVHKLEQLEENPYISFDKVSSLDAFRWSSNIFLLSDKPASEGLSLRIEWMEGISYADFMEPCMYIWEPKRRMAL